MKKLRSDRIRVRSLHSSLLESQSGKEGFEDSEQSHNDEVECETGILVGYGTRTRIDKGRLMIYAYHYPSSYLGQHAFKGLSVQDSRANGPRVLC